MLIGMLGMLLKIHMLVAAAVTVLSSSIGSTLVVVLF